MSDRPRAHGGEPHGVLVVDKAEGPTSHDVVGRVRRLLHTRRVGHAGTLDPMASGVLVVLVGEATKLGPYLTAHRKRYAARVSFGRATDTLDRLGATIAEAEVPAWLRDEIAARALDPSSPTPRIEAALAAERARRAQTPPAFSAIKVDGRRSYDRARAGEEVTLDERPVEVFDLRILHAALPTEANEQPQLPSLDLELDVSKGYYVRSLARDLGAHLGVPAHLSALRRLASGPFTLSSAASLADAPPDALLAALIPVPLAAARALPCGTLSDLGARRASQGQLLDDTHFTTLPPLDEPSAWLSGSGRLIAVGTRQPDRFVLHRGFVEERTPASGGSLPADRDPGSSGAAIVPEAAPSGDDRDRARGDDAPPPTTREDDRDPPSKSK